MFRAVLVLALIAAPAYAALPLLALELIGPTDVIGLIDHLTKSETPTSVDVQVGAMVSQGKLLVGRLKVNVTMERSSRNWRGQVMSQLTVPTEISYAIELSGIRPEHVRLDVKNKLLVVTMPAPRVESVTPVLAEVKQENTFRAARFRMLDRHVGTEMQNTMLLHDYQARAREAGESHAAAMRAEGRTRLQGLLQTLMAKSCPGLIVLVE